MMRLLSAQVAGGGVRYRTVCCRDEASYLWEVAGFWCFVKNESCLRGAHVARL